MQNTMDACISGVLWFLVGHPFSHGSDLYGVVGSSWEGLSGCARYSKWMFGWAFAATASTIVSGAVAERCRFPAYIVYTSILTSLVYPVVAHWAWHEDGWLANLPAGGFHDFGGSGVVHATGGVAALIGAAVIGPRTGRFDELGRPVHMPGQSPLFAVVGTLILWFGWYAFNGASSGTYGDMYTSSRVCVTTTISAASAGCASPLICLWVHKKTEVGAIINGILAGLVAITAPCAVVEPYAAAVIGLVAAATYHAASTMLLRLHIDDPLDASPVHFFCGLWGLVAVGLFATEEYMSEGSGWGLLYGGNLALMGNQLAGAISITAWCSVLSGCMFAVLNVFDLLRLPLNQEMADPTHDALLGLASTFSIPGQYPQKPSDTSMPKAAEQLYSVDHNTKQKGQPKATGEGLVYAGIKASQAASRRTKKNEVLPFQDEQSLIGADPTDEISTDSYTSSSTS